MRMARKKDNVQAVTNMPVRHNSINQRNKKATIYLTLVCPFVES